MFQFQLMCCIYKVEMRLDTGYWLSENGDVYSVFVHFCQKIVLIINTMLTINVVLAILETLGGEAAFGGQSVCLEKSGNLFEVLSHLAHELSQNGRRYSLQWYFLPCVLLRNTHGLLFHIFHVILYLSVGD